MEQENLQTLVDSVLRGLFVELEASGRHVHLTADQSRALFGHELTPKRPLSQPGQFLANERVTVVGPKGEFSNVAVLGPERKEAQVEISLTDARTLGVEAPIRLSGERQLRLPSRTHSTAIGAEEQICKTAARNHRAHGRSS